MPIYAYKCESCGHSKDVLQKMSDAPLTVCPNCGEAAFKKQVTAAGFQLKGSGWYVTDFRGGSYTAPAASGGSAEGAAPVSGGKSGDSPAPAPAATATPAADKSASTPSSTSTSSGSSAKDST